MAISAAIPIACSYPLGKESGNLVALFYILYKNVAQSLPEIPA
jgi:hypothetical protein